MDAPKINRNGIGNRVEQDLEGHLRALRSKLERAVRRGEPVDRLEARIRSEEDLLRRMRTYRHGVCET
ncbi:uncharacterized protein sS8_4279 [Methylocaldum marinum]|uniref:Uncharacterized protein n=1 Tax=Methylocaldum marinum TaxID=1432792 RepID=A0A250L1Q9_9GAMM|nr:hypothetical protein [Methylocaldum marinum]BBA36209.1 uncharacterized protein sS8_4279 [Methylocaldum marinum]